MVFHSYPQHSITNIVVNSNNPPQGFNFQIWKKMIIFTINNSEFAGAENNFPIKLNYIITDLIGHTQPNGEDLRFETILGENIDYEIVSFNSLTGHMIVWVRIQNLTSTLQIVMFYDNPYATDAQNPKDVWTNGYVVVLHCNNVEIPIDSTGNFVLSQVGADTLIIDSDIGPIKNAVATTPTSFYRIPDILPEFGSGNHITISAWATVDLTGTNRAIITNSFNSGVLFFALALRNTDKPTALFHSSLVSKTAISPDALDSNLHYWVGTYDKTKVRLYIDEIEKATYSTTEDLPRNNKEWNVFHRWDTESDQAYQWDGPTGEIFIENVTRNQTWIKNAHRNQKPNSTFFTVGPPTEI